MEFIQSIDEKILLIINGLNCDILDSIMFWLSNTWFWLPLYIILIYQILKNYGKKGIFIIIISLLVIAICDQIASHLIKNTVQRLRPSHSPGLENLLHYVNNYRGGKYGFVSSHAANSFGLAAFLFKFFNDKKKWLSYFLIIAAILISYSRIYLGVHFPSDVFAGAIVGVFIGFISYIIFIKKFKR